MAWNACIRSPFYDISTNFFLIANTDSCSLFIPCGFVSFCSIFSYSAGIDHCILSVSVFLSTAFLLSLILVSISLLPLKSPFSFAQFPSIASPSPSLSGQKKTWIFAIQVYIYYDFIPNENGKCFFLASSPRLPDMCVRVSLTRCFVFSQSHHKSTGQSGSNSS